MTIFVHHLLRTIVLLAVTAPDITVVRALEKKSMLLSPVPLIRSAIRIIFLRPFVLASAWFFIPRS